MGSKHPPSPRLSSTPVSYKGEWCTQVTWVVSAQVIRHLLSHPRVPGSLQTGTWRHSTGMQNGDELPVLHAVAWKSKQLFLRCPMVPPALCLSGVGRQVDLSKDLSGKKNCLHFSVLAGSYSLRKAIVAGFPMSHCHSDL